MKLIYDDKIITLSEETLDYLRGYAIGMMDAMRKSEPETAWCWNVCKITFGDYGEPSFEYADTETSLSPFGGPCISASHPNPLPEPPKRKPRAKKPTNRKGTRNG